MTLDELQRELDTRDDGVLKSGSHQPGREFCALEFEAQVRGREWSDVPITLPDLRPLNDAPWSSDALRTQHLLPVMVAYWDWAEWTEARRKAVTARVIILTVNRLIADLPGFSDQVRAQCRAASTLAEAQKAARAASEAAWAETAARAETARAETARAAAMAASEAAAATAAAAAARAASEAARAETARAWADQVLIAACALWIEATREL